MYIESVNIINLERRTDLEIAQRAVWTAMGANEDRLRIHKARDGLWFENRNQVCEQARDDGFDWFTDIDDEDLWMGVGELCCLWSISRLLRKIGHEGTEDHAYLYVLADRFSKKRLPYLEQLFDRLPDFMLFQFKGYVPHWDHLDRGDIKASIPKEFLPGDDIIPSNQIQEGYTKHGDGVLGMTPAGARYMLQLAEEKYEFPVPYEIMLWHEGINNVCPKGVYSTICAEYDFSDESTEWEGEFPHPLAGWHASDIGEANRQTETGGYRNPNQALEQDWFQNE